MRRAELRSDEPSEDPALARWMAEYQAGSLRAFDQLYQALARDVRPFLASLARDSSKADDLLQETFLQIHRSRASHLPGHPVRPWVFAIARRVYLMEWRAYTRRVRRERVAAETHAAASYPVDLQTRAVLDSAVRTVPPKSRRAFLLHHLRGFSFEEVGAMLGITAGAAKIRSSRAVRAMRAFLEDRR